MTSTARTRAGWAGGSVGRWWAGRTLRWRLVAGLLALLAVTFAVIGVTTALALRGFLLDRLDQQLPEATGPVASWLHTGAGAPGTGPSTVGGGSPVGERRGDGGTADGDDDHEDDGDDDALLRGQQPGSFGALLAGGDVTATSLATRGPGGTEALVSPRLSGADVTALAALPTSGRPSTVTLDEAGSLRARAVVTGGGEVMVVGLPTAGVDATTGRLAGIEAVVFTLAAVLAGLVGALWVRAALRPLRRVGAAASRVAATPMASGDVVMPAGVGETDERTEVGQVGAAFDLMLVRVGGALAERQATEERLRRFVADASHELRTPLAAIRGHSELAGRRAGELPPDVAHALHRVHSESLRMGVLVDDLLLLARLDAGRPLAREEVDLTRLALDATSDARAADRGADRDADHRAGDRADQGPGAAADRRWLLELPEEPVVVTGDAHRLHQVLANLLANARTHTPPGTEVCVSLRAAGASHVEVSVTDDGPGVPPEVAGRVFERFVRADSSRARGHGTGSSGLGLAIVAAVVAAHGGAVDLQTRPGRTSFAVRLPRQQGTVAPECRWPGELRGAG